jgi:hypothetical protein
MSRRFLFIVSVGIILVFLAPFVVVFFLAQRPGADLVNVILTAATMAMAIATVEVALGSVYGIYQGQKQARETLYAQSYPILVPKGRSANEHVDPEHEPFKWQAEQHNITIENVGTGVALNIWGVLLPPDDGPRSVLPPQFFMRWRAPIKPGETVTTLFKSGGFVFHCNDKIGKHPLCVPREHAPIKEFRNLTDRTPRYWARLTLTYSDVFGRKHASIFDYSIADTWSHVDFLKEIPKRLDEMDQEKWPKHI